LVAGEVGKIYDLISIATYVEYNSAQYVTGGELQIKRGTSSASLVPETTATLGEDAYIQSYSYSRKGAITEDVQMRGGNYGLYLTTETSNPTVGDSNIDVYLTYKLIDVS